MALTDIEVEQEIKRLLESPHVKLAKKAEKIKHRRRQYMYSLHSYEKKGKELEKMGITSEMLDYYDDNGGNFDENGNDWE
jgi:uncharacterized protein YxeA